MNTNIATPTPMATPPTVDTATVTPTPVPTMDDGGLVDGVVENIEGGSQTNEKIQWLTLVIIGLTVVSLVLSIVNNKKQIERLEEEEGNTQSKLQELEFNLKKQMGNKYESLAE
jgi:hypothetical protein